jgi:hypothetical protein
MNASVIQRLSFALVWSAGLMLAAGCNKPTTTDGGKPSSPTSSPAGGEPSADVKPSPPIEVTADQLADAFLTDENAAKAKYKDKWLIVDGLYEKAYERNVGGRSIGRKLWFMEYKDPKKRGICTVGCDVDAGPWPKVEGLTKGQKVKIKAHFKTGDKQTVDLAQCELLEVGPDPTIVVTAAQLTKDYAAGKEAARGKYSDEKPVLVEGVVFETSAKDEPTIILEGFDEKAPKPVRVEAHFDKIDRAGLPPEKVKKGDKVKIKGLAELYRGEGSVYLDKCKVMR